MPDNDILDGHPKFCPTCGAPTVYRTMPEWLLGHWKYGRYPRILAALIEARRNRRGLTMDEMVEAAYKGIGKPPKEAERGIFHTMNYNKNKLNSLGWEILTTHKTGCGYWLVPIEME